MITHGVGRPPITPWLTNYTIGLVSVRMALNIKNSEVERLAAEVAALARESKTEAIRRALLERRERLAMHIVHDERHRGLLEFLERDVWPSVPAAEIGRRLSGEEEAAILGFGSEGV